MNDHVERICGTCRHWSGHGLTSGGAHECERVPMQYDAYCWDEAGENVLKPEYEGVTAFVVDGSSYYAALVTLPTFGCNLWEQTDDR